ncbi:MAG: NAD-binding protein [Gemmataceae bacterium]
MDQRPVVLCGLGRVGWRVFDFLRATGVPVTVVDQFADPADPRLAGVPVVKGDCRDPKVLERAGVPAARGVLIVTSDDLVNVATALLVRRLNPDGRVVVRMFNQTLIPRLGAAVKNTAALSVSALTAPLLALSALTGEGLGAFKLDDGPHQIAEVPVPAGSDLVGRRVSDVAGQFHLLVLAHTPAGGPPNVWHTVAGDTRLSPGDRLVACGRPADLEPLLEGGRGGLFPGVRWAGRVRRGVRLVRRTLAEIDLSVKLGTLALLLTLGGSTAVFRYGFGFPWADSLFQTVRVIATGADLSVTNPDPWAKVFLSGLKIAGAALLAGFTAIFTQYLVRAKLGGAFEVGRIPDGGHVVVCGLGNVGFRCVEELVRLGVPVVAVDKAADNPFAATVRRMGVPVVVGDVTVPEVLRQTRAETARAVIAATSSELANLEVALLVREKNPDQRVVVRLTDPDFAQAVREAANVKLAVSVPNLAAPAFAAALYGDRVHTLVSVGGMTLAVVELVVQPNDPCLHEVSLMAAMVDYRFLPVGVSGREPFAGSGIPTGYRLKAGDRLTAVLALPDLERLLRREPAAAEWAVEVEVTPRLTTAGLIPVIRTARGCSQTEAEELLKKPAFTLATGITRGLAEELAALVARERAVGRVVQV